MGVSVSLRLSVTLADTGYPTATLDEFLPLLKDPLYNIVDMLGANDVNDRHAAEAWIRNHLRSFVPVISMLLQDVLSVSVSLRPHSSAAADVEIRGFVYERPFDSRSLTYSLRTLNSLLKEGGLSCLRSLRSSNVQASEQALQTACTIGEDLFLDRLRAQLKLTISAAQFRTDQNLLDLLVDVLARILHTSYSVSHANAMKDAVDEVQAEAADCLQHIASRQHVSAPRSQELIDILLQRCAGAIAQADVLPQNRFLRAIHALLHELLTQHPQALSQQMQTQLLRVFQRALSSEDNRAVLPHWADFAFSVLSLLRGMNESVLLPLTISICELLIGTDANTAEETDVTILINLAERIATSAIESSVAEMTAIATARSEAVSEAPTGILSYVVGHKSKEGSRGSEHSGAGPVDAALGRLVEALVGFMCTEAVGERAPTVLRIQARSRRALERLYRIASLEVFVALTSSWHRSDDEDDRKVMDIIDSIVPSEQIAVTYLTNLLSTGLSSSSEKSKRKETETEG